MTTTNPDEFGFPISSRARRVAPADRLPGPDQAMQTRLDTHDDARRLGAALGQWPTR